MNYVSKMLISKVPENQVNALYSSIRVYVILFLTLDKNFVLDNFRFVQDNKYFVRAEGRGIRLKFSTELQIIC